MIDVPVAAKPTDNPPPGPLRALYDWVTGAATPPAAPPPPIHLPLEGVPTRIGHYAITRKLGGALMNCATG